ncbi:MAG: branched-chain amino acid ABC transporter permease [Christensenellaceae bacterium]|jgi:branched-chain amino acid transport system permease protein|nr:branched-chain amino acid ABC transporter permease [Christensenellaceae bacterium]
MSVFFQQLVNGLSLGSVYALMAVGYSLVYSIMNFSNFAHGGVIMVGAYIGFFAMTALGLPFAVAFFVCGAGAGLLAVLLERLVYRPLRSRNAPFLYFIISAMGASIFLENFVIATIGPTFRTYPPVFGSAPFNVGGISIGRIDVFMIIVAALGLLLLMFIIEKTKIGLAIRASSYNIKASTLMGVNVNMVIFTIFLLGGVLAGYAGMLFGMKYTVYPQIGNITTKSFIAAVFGGLGSLPGAIIGSLILGLLETSISAIGLSSWRDLFSFAVLIFVLVIKPSGLMGKFTEDKA